MALVAYGSSDESSHESDEENVQETKIDDVVPVNKNNDIKLEIASDKKLNSDLNKYVEDPATESMNGNVKHKANKQSAASSIRNQIRSELFKKIPVPGKSASGKAVAISIPSLEEFEEEQIEEDQPKPKKVKSSTECALFSLLPAPKNVTTKELNRPLIPHAVSKAKAAKSTAKVVNKYLKPEADASSSDSIDFFSLSEKDEVTKKKNAKNIFKNDSGNNGLDVNKVRPAPEGSFSYNQGAGPPVATVEYNPEPEDPENDPNPYEDESFLKLMGKKKGESIDFIDINEDDQRASIEEWKTKSMSEEQPVHSSQKNPTGALSKKKHQITYLAFQAKQRETELKNSWAQSRMTRKQTQAKYGF